MDVISTDEISGIYVDTREGGRHHTATFGPELLGAVNLSLQASCDEYSMVGPIEGMCCCLKLEPELEANGVRDHENRGLRDRNEKMG